MRIAAVIVVEVNSLLVLFVIGRYLGIAALTAKFSPRYWIYMALNAPTAVCPGCSQVRMPGEQRRIDTLAGAGLLLITACVALGYASGEARACSARRRSAR